ncbi:hypothetical protein N7499_010747 [Penicillium canescens]|uniref:Uncharacterized protein n=1 Tax=Penicillium canescens TaxID=5083 RepID=A0AAD6IJH2_PENCN|nr:uncharacterized protein N7446_006015 [Penicillium canescens]KAJ5990220.1 hypothetical protein N7522_010427 [Penicillium canescens]KAJ6051383.1 hypothetical protein N7460_001917 [Penicillium canescens]KAJ6061895.1 hypothetical protein N7446_006015 [Penicillium canescens]KAJ6065145.1 hypothetical protein N7444_000798 [Penicillium canescens]KAJ6068860.1 hypothetical protein N7499_010747 [Penicillium canescens]
MPANHASHLCLPQLLDKLLAQTGSIIMAFIIIATYHGSHLYLARETGQSPYDDQNVGLFHLPCCFVTVHRILNPGPPPGPEKSSHLPTPTH